MSNEVDPIPEITVIITTYNRVDLLMRCLEHLERQTFSDFEVIVVDDGSSDPTPQVMTSYLAEARLRIRYHRQANSGPASARNIAISMAETPISIFIGDDILVSPDFIAVHLRLHREEPALNVAGLGLTKWSESGQMVTPFMRWLDKGFQFDYAALLRGKQANWQHFYTSNLSVKTDLIRRHPFNERFPMALGEDSELGYRLHKQEGLRIVFLPAALAEHVHPTDLRKSCRRAYEIGKVSLLFDEVWPELKPVRYGLLRPMFVGSVVRIRWLLPAVLWLEERLTRHCCPNLVVMPLLRCYRLLGRCGVAFPEFRPSDS